MITPGQVPIPPTRPVDAHRAYVTAYEGLAGRTAPGELGSRLYRPGLVFVIMAFEAKGMAGVYEVIKKACARLDLTATRGDESIGSKFVMLHVAEQVRAAEYVICDQTGERPNVYYELGYAHGLGNDPDNILLIAQPGTTLHFDVDHFATRFYGSLKELDQVVTERLGEMIASKAKMRRTKSGDHRKEGEDELN